MSDRLEFPSQQYVDDMDLFDEINYNLDTYEFIVTLDAYLEGVNFLSKNGHVVVYRDSAGDIDFSIYHADHVAFCDAHEFTREYETLSVYIIVEERHDAVPVSLRYNLDISIIGKDSSGNTVLVDIDAWNWTDYDFLDIGFNVKETPCSTTSTQ